MVFFNLIFNELSDSVHLMGKGNNYPPPTIRDLFFCWLAFSMVSWISCYFTVPSIIWGIFSNFIVFCNLLIIIRRKFEKQGKYLQILHEATCNDYFIVECLLKSNVARVILLTCYLYEACLIEFTANLVQTSRNNNCKY